MSHFTDTARALSQISDEGLFEHLAVAVLRRSRPELYSNLTQPGTNASGKPVKSPVDALSFVPNAAPRHMVAAHHTTCRQADIEKKWLHDPSTVKTRRERKPTAPAGDIVKTAALVADERTNSPDLLTTLALTTNEEPPQDVTRKAESVAASHGITLDIWSRSRIADYLDNTPDGQWLRQTFLGITQERLSLDLLFELGRKSLEAHRPRIREEELIIRDSAVDLIELLPSPVGFLVGESGFGKSVACYQFLKQHVERGGCCLVLPDEILTSSISIDHALEAALYQLHPSLAPGSGAEARSLCSEDMPLLIVVEDISRSGNSAQLIDRLARWSGNSRSQDQPTNTSWRIICPMWPELLGALRDDTRKDIAPLVQRLGTFTREEARCAVKRRAAIEEAEISELDADAISAELGFDPLLIALHNLEPSTPPGDVISTFIQGSAERVAASGAYTAYEHREALRVMAQNMLAQRQLAPLWSEVLAWFESSPSQLTSLREQAKYGEVIRFVNSPQGMQLGFRHDRVRKWLLTAAAIHNMMNEILSAEVFAEPFFSDIIGTAISSQLVSPSMAERTCDSNPLALFYALQAFREPSSPVHHAVLEAIESWLSDPMSHSRAHQSLRYAALGVLSETQSSYVCKFLSKFRDRSWAGYVAGLRNGDLKSGIRLCLSLEPGTGSLWRDRAMNHARMNFGSKLVAELETLLKDPTIGDSDIVGGLRLAGHLGDTALAGSIGARWNIDSKRSEHLADYLWAAAQCGGEHTEQLLAPVCDTWAALSDEPDRKGMPSPRDSLAAHHIAWAFWQALPEPALRYFISRAASHDLRWPIVYMLHGIDHPEGVAFLVEYMAERSRKLEGKNGFDTFPGTLERRWRRWDGERVNPMSKESRACLQSLWEEESNDKHLRKQALRLWATTTHPDDIAILRSQPSNEFLADNILRARLERGDQDAVPELIGRIKAEEDHNGTWWYVARHIWSDSLTSALDEYLGHQAKTLKADWDASNGAEWIVSELLMGLDVATSEMLLCKHWDFLRFSPRYVQAALYLATPRLLVMVEKAVHECPDPVKIFEHIDMQFGVKTIGRPGVTRIEQLQALIPYLDHLSESSVHAFWEVCNERGWMTLRRDHLDARLGEWRKRVGLEDSDLLAELDKELTYDRPHWLDHWVDRHLDTGRNIDDILSILKQWLRANRNPKALQIAASVIMYAGARADVAILNEGSDHSDIAAEIIADTYFAVKRRTLT